MKDYVSFEIAKKLKDAGWDFKEDSDHYWMYAKSHFLPCRGKTPESCKCSYELICNFESCDYDGGCNHDREHSLATTTIGELLEALPKTRLELKTQPGENGWFAISNIGPFFLEEAPNPADALALLWMALKEKGAL